MHQRSVAPPCSAAVAEVFVRSIMDAGVHGYNHSLCCPPAGLRELSGEKSDAITTRRRSAIAEET
eukprot:1503146-Pyramimonas_sp.AAC.1